MSKILLKTGLAAGLAATLIGLPGEPAVDLSVAGSGPVADFTADVRLLSDGSERLAGQVRVGQQS